VYYVKEDYWPHDTTLWVKDFKGNDPRFVFYFFLGRARELASLDVGSANPTLNRNHVHPICVNWPPLDEQRAIAHILGSIDDKIALNCRINETLEAMARALFKSWFVDFDPVRAKAAGRRPTGMDEATAELFPDGTKVLSGNEVPEGWGIKPLYDCASWVNGAAYRDFDFSPPGTGLPIVKIAELKSGIAPQTRWTLSNPGERYRICTGDILFSWSGNPDTSIDTFVWSGGEAWLNQHIFKVITDTPDRRSFVLSLLRFLRPRFAEIARDKQTTGLGHVTAGDMKRLQVVFPPAAVSQIFHRQVEPLYSLVHSRNMENEQLQKLREALLPRLLSGELRVPEAERLVAGA
jgi:type I restriction enzyme S subunit